MGIKKKIEKLSNSSGVSGYERETAHITKEFFKDFCKEVSIDHMGNVIGVKKGSGSGKKIMLMAHIDEIGLMISNIDKNGLLEFTTLGGFDPRTLIYQDVLIHSKEKLNGIIVPRSDFKLKENMNKSIGIKDLRIDMGYDSKESISKVVEIGDIITIDRKLKSLSGNYVTGKAMDDRACVASLIECGRELIKLNHEFDVYFVGSVQEEVGTRGAVTAAYKINPDLGIAVDVTHGHIFDLVEEDTVKMGEGAGLTIGGNIHKGFRDFVVKVANEYDYSYQTEVTPGQTGTDARSIQLTKSGIPTVLLAVPLRYMHTSIETVKTDDILSIGRLLARVISEINDKSLEEITCY